MSFWVWWLVPAVATVVALIIVGFRARPGKPAEPESGMAELERFREAMERPLPREGRAFARPDESWGEDTGEIPIVPNNWSK